MIDLKLELINYGISKFSSYLDYLEKCYYVILDNPDVTYEDYLYYDREVSKLYVVRDLMMSYLTDLKSGRF